MEFPHISFQEKHEKALSSSPAPSSPWRMRVYVDICITGSFGRRKSWALLGSPSSDRVGGLLLRTPSRGRSETVLKAHEEVWQFEDLFIFKVLWLLALTVLYKRTDPFSSLSNSHVSSYDWSQFPVRHTKKKKEWSRGLKYMQTGLARCSSCSRIKEHPGLLPCCPSSPRKECLVVEKASGPFSV